MKKTAHHSVCLILVSLILGSCGKTTDPELDLPDTNEIIINLHKVIWTGEKFVAVGNRIYTSPDGISWTFIKPNKALPGPLIDIFYADGKYLGVCEEFILVSNDLKSWTYEYSCENNEKLIKIARSGNRYVVSGYKPNSGCYGCLVVNPFVLHSADGDSWTMTSIGNNLLFSGIVWADSQFIGMAGEIRTTSADGTTWTKDTANMIIDGNLTWTGEKLVCVGGFSGSTVYSSSDGISWTVNDGSIAYGSCIILADTLYVGVGMLGGVYSSGNLDTLTLRHSVYGWSLYDVTWNEQIFVTVGCNTILTSNDGITWTRQDFL